jgi:hypothetical protein
LEAVVLHVVMIVAVSLSGGRECRGR